MPYDDQQRTNLRGIIDKLDGLGDAVGGWSAKSECRQTGASVHLKFEKKVDVMTTMAFVETIQQVPSMLNDACGKLLAADDEIVRLREALLKLKQWDMLTLTDDGHGSVTADAPWAHEVIDGALNG